jgi:membrane protein YdbS with pleckstrin-like domain
MIRRIHDLPVASPLLAALVLIIAAAAHAGVWYFISRHLGLSGALASALIALAVIKHLGWIGGAYALVKRRRAAQK